MLLAVRQRWRTKCHILSQQNSLARTGLSLKYSRKGKSDEGDNSGKKPKGKAPNQGYWDDNYDTDKKFEKKIESDIERLMRMGEKEADPKDMDVTSRIEGEGRPTRTWVDIGQSKNKKGTKNDDEK